MNIIINYNFKFVIHYSIEIKFFCTKGKNYEGYEEILSYLLYYELIYCCYHFHMDKISKNNAIMKLK